MFGGRKASKPRGLTDGESDLTHKDEAYLNISVRWIVEDAP